VVAGHFGLAAIVKSRAPSTPLWALMLATQWLDVFFVPLFLIGVETIEAVDPANPNAYGAGIIHADYTHSLVGALLLSALAGLLAGFWWSRGVGLVVGALAFSHWVLDLVVHRADLPLLPGNVGGLPLLGFGLWQVRVVAALVELALVLAGAFLYYRAATNLPTDANARGQGQRKRALTASGVVAGLMLLSLATNVLGV
jgi:hypothetical protein